MKTTQTTIIVLVAFLFHFSTYAQERYDVKLINDTVYNHDVPQFRPPKRSPNIKRIVFGCFAA